MKLAKYVGNLNLWQWSNISTAADQSESSIPESCVIKTKHMDDVTTTQNQKRTTKP